jgi:hypothetical protein
MIGLINEMRAAPIARAFDKGISKRSFSTM